MRQKVLNPLKQKEIMPLRRPPTSKTGETKEAAEIIVETLKKIVYIPSERGWEQLQQKIKLVFLPAKGRSTAYFPIGARLKDPYTIEEANKKLKEELKNYDLEELKNYDLTLVVEISGMLRLEKQQKPEPFGDLMR